MQSSARHAQYLKMDSSAKRDRLRDIIVEKSYRFRPEGFKLASGRISQFFFNLKPTMLDPEGINLLADLLIEDLRKEGIRCIGGPVMGAVPLVDALSVKSFGVFELATFFVRKEAKDHGVKQKIDGTLLDNSEVAVIDDVVTTGGSVQIAVDAARERGCTVNRAWVVIDREEGAAERLQEQGIGLRSLFKRSDFAT